MNYKYLYVVLRNLLGNSDEKIKNKYINVELNLFRHYNVYKRSIL